MGLFRIQSSTRSSFRRASLGTLLCLIGLVAGGVVGVSKWHHAIVLNHEPVELTCSELLQSGVPEGSSVVRLTDPQVHSPGELQLSAEDAVNLPGLDKIQSLLADPRVQGVVDRLARGDVSPRGVRSHSDYQPFRLSMGRSTVQSAQDEIAQQGTLTVHVSEDPTARMTCQLATLLNYPLPKTLTDRAELPAYTLHPVSLIGSHREAFAWTVGGSIALALGLVLCGSATLGWWAILSPFAAVIGLLGIPLRNGRGNGVTRRITATVGLGLLGAALYLCMSPDMNGQSGGLWLWLAAAWFAGSLGLAALGGVWFNGRAARIEGQSINTPSRFACSKIKQSKAKRQTEFNRQIAAKPTQLRNMLDVSEYTRRYLDAKLSVPFSGETSGELAMQASSLGKMEFDTPLRIEHCAEDHLISATVQIGCRSLVMIVMEETGHGLKIRLTSILEDGHVILSRGGVEDRFDHDFAVDTTTVHIFDSSTAAKLVTLHLERAAVVAQQRQTKLVSLDPNEWRDLIHYSERCLAQATHETKLERWEVLDAHYGRFSFPPRAVLTPAMA